MIQCTFQHVKGVYRKGEERLWQSGINSWKKLIETPKKHPHFTQKLWNKLRTEIIQAKRELDNENYDYFLKIFPEELYWRLIPNLIDKILYLDIEATGLTLGEDTITTIATFDGSEIKYFVRGINLEDFIPYLDKFDVISTFDGEKMDLPFIEHEFGYIFYQLHYDLFKFSRRVRFSGGLKQIEQFFGISREDLTGIDGRMAIYLWNEYKQTNDERYLDTLLAYNVEDVINLEQLLIEFYDRMKNFDRLPIKSLDLHPKKIIRPKKPDNEIIEIIKEKYYPNAIEEV